MLPRVRPAIVKGAIAYRQKNGKNQLTGVIAARGGAYGLQLEVSAMAALEVSLLGAFEARLEAGPAFDLPTRKTKLLLSFLALSPG